MADTPPKLYLIPGLGADGRIFEGLRREGLEFEVIEHIPALKGERLRDYSIRLGQQIATDQPFYIGGMSLGGIVAGEIALALNAEKLVVISSVKDSGELPLHFKMARWLPIYKLFSGRFMRKYGPRASHKHLAPWQSKILKDMRDNCDPEFLTWAAHAVIHWRRRTVHPRMIHIHGTRDHMFPSMFLQRHVHVTGGTHVMVLARAREVTDVVKGFLGFQ